MPRPMPIQSKAQHKVSKAEWSKQSVARTQLHHNYDQQQQMLKGSNTKNVKCSNANARKKMRKRKCTKENAQNKSPTTDLCGSYAVDPPLEGDFQRVAGGFEVQVLDEQSGFVELGIAVVLIHFVVQTFCLRL